ncbi:MAG: hypothetical protein R3Y53_06240 [Bacillota bacterium]
MPKLYEINGYQIAELMEEVNDARLLALATARMENYNARELISGEEVFRNLGITEDDLLGFEEVELE